MAEAGTIRRPAACPPESTRPWEGNPVSTITTNAVQAAIRAYTRPNLRIYDAVTMRFLAHAVWRCPASLFINHYDALVSTNHADLGVGTGYCLDHCRAPIDRLALFDLNPNCLEYASRRLARFRPTVHVRNVLETVYSGAGPFASIGLGGVLHCLPGSMADKGRVFDNIKPILTRQTVVFGYTLISDPGVLRPPARLVRALLNRTGVINNYHDTSDGLRHELEQRFDRVIVTRAGAFAFFIASQCSGRRLVDAQIF